MAVDHQPERVFGMKKVKVKKVKWRCLFILRHADWEQAAWVRADTLPEASRAFFSKTDVPMVVHNDAGWVLLPENTQHEKTEPLPMPHWEFLTNMRGVADLKGMPKFIQALGEQRPPQLSGQVVIGKKFTRSTSLELRSVSASMVIGANVYHRGYPAPYRINADQVSGHRERNLDSIEVGGIALIVLAEKKDEEVYKLTFLDTVDMRLKGDKHDYLVTAKFVRKAILVNVLAIKEL